MFHGLSKADRSQIRGMSAILYTGEYNDNRADFFYFGPNQPHTAGANVLVHPSGTKPDMDLAITAGSGTETTLTVTQSARSRLGSPYSNCTTQSYLVPGDDKAT